MLLKSIKLCLADIKKTLKTPKLYLIISFCFFFMDNFARAIRVLAVHHDLGVTPYLYPIFMCEWENRLFVTVLMVAMMSDAPFINGLEKNIFLKVDDVTWLISKIWFIIYQSVLLQMVLYVMSVLVCLPRVGLSFKWGSAIEIFTRGMNSGIDYIGTSNSGAVLVSVTNPLEAVLNQMFISVALNVFMGLLIMLFNIVFKNSLGTICAAVYVLADSIADEIEWLHMGGIRKFFPTTWLSMNIFYDDNGITYIVALSVLIIGCLILIGGMIALAKKRIKFIIT